MSFTIQETFKFKNTVATYFLPYHPNKDEGNWKWWSHDFIHDGFMCDTNIIFEWHKYTKKIIEINNLYVPSQAHLLQNISGKTAERFKWSCLKCLNEGDKVWTVDGWEEIKSIKEIENETCEDYLETDIGFYFYNNFLIHPDDGR